MVNVIFWILAASFAGFIVAAIFAGLLKLNRNVYLLIYIPAVLILVYLFVKYARIPVKETVLHNIIWGLAGAIVISPVLIRNVLSQPASERSKGFAFLTDIVWPGLIYGICDALLLSVLPVLAVRMAFSSSDFSSWTVKAGFFLSALAASLIITTAYHLGYPEFRGKKVIFANVGNGIMTIAMLLTMNPLTAIIPHSVMHIASMIHGKETTGQVPPHYK